MHRQEPAPSQIARLTDEQSGYDFFRAAHLVPNLPCIFPPNCTESWPIRRRIASEAGHIDYMYLEEQYGSLPVACVDCEASTPQPAASEEPPVACFRDLLQLWRRGRGRSKYLKDWHLPLAVHRAGADGEETAAAAFEKGKQRVRQELYDVPPLWLDDWMNEYECSAREDDFRFVVRASARSPGPTLAQALNSLNSTLAVATHLRRCTETSVSPAPAPWFLRRHVLSCHILYLCLRHRRLLLLDQHPALWAETLVPLPAAVFRLVAGPAPTSRASRDERQLRYLDGRAQGRVRPARNARRRARSWRIHLHVRCRSLRRVEPRMGPLC